MTVEIWRPIKDWEKRSDVRQIRKLSPRLSQRELGRIFGVSHSRITGTSASGLASSPSNGSFELKK